MKERVQKIIEAGLINVELATLIEKWKVIPGLAEAVESFQSASEELEKSFEVLVKEFEELEAEEDFAPPFEVLLDDIDPDNRVAVRYCLKGDNPLSTIATKYVTEGITHSKGIIISCPDDSLRPRFLDDVQIGDGDWGYVLGVTRIQDGMILIEVKYAVPDFKGLEPKASSR